MSVVIVIPARFASSRFPGKPLAELTGVSGQPRSLIRRSWDAAKQVDGVDSVVVATDDYRIADAANAFGAEVVMTSADCKNGTERCADALSHFPADPELVINLQGDAPLTPPWFVEALIADLKANPDVGVATPVLRCDGAAAEALRADRRAGRVGGTTAIFGADRRGLYFSKEVIPYAGADVAPDAPSPVYHHVGVYGYRSDVLRAYAGWPEGRLEVIEGLEQLRFLERGVPLLCTEVEGRDCPFWELNNPEDVPVIEEMMRARGMA